MKSEKGIVIRVLLTLMVSLSVSANTIAKSSKNLEAAKNDELIDLFPDPVYLGKGSKTPWVGYLVHPTMFELQADDADLVTFYQEQAKEARKQAEFYKTEYWEKWKWALGALLIGGAVGFSIGSK